VSVQQQPPYPGPLSPRLRTLVEAQLAEHGAIIQRMVQCMDAQIGDYRQLADPAIKIDIQDSLDYVLQLWLRGLLDDRWPSALDLEPLVAYGRRRVHQGISMESLMQAARSGARLLWEETLKRAESDSALMPELLYRLSPRLLAYFDLVGQTLADAYAEERRERLSWRDRLRYELCRLVFNNPEDVDGFRSRMSALGMDSSALHVGLALRMRSGDGLAFPDSRLNLLFTAIRRLLESDSEALLRTVRHGHLLIWAPLLAGESLIEGEARLAAQMQALLRANAGVAAIGLGLPDSGPRGWQLSAEQALKALDLGARLEPQQVLHRYFDFALYDALSQSDNVWRFHECLIERLSREAHLTRTLEAYFEHRQHRKAVAGALDIHPNTLSYRLERIETILGARLDEVNWQSRLHAALRLRRLHNKTDPG